MKKLFRNIVIVAAALAVSACTYIETGHVGVYTSWNGIVKMEELPPGGPYQTVIGSIKDYVANEITLTLDNLTPQTKDRTKLNELDLTFTYSIAPGAVADMITRYKGRDLFTQHGVYPAGAYVQNVVTAAAGDVIGTFDALEANTNRQAMPKLIIDRAKVLLAEEGLQDKVKIHQVFIKALNIDPALMASARAVITAQNELTAKDYEVKTAKKEAERMQLLAQQGGPAYVQLLTAQTGMKIAEAIEKGKVHTIVVPSDFKGIVNAK